MTNKYFKYLMIFLGILFTTLGFVGILLPLLPTTPFLLLAAACFSKSSERFYQALLNNKWLGSYIKNYRDGKGIPLKTKIIAIAMLWTGILYSAIFVVPVMIGKVILMVIACGVTTHIVMIRPRKNNQSQMNKVDSNQKKQ